MRPLRDEEIIPEHHLSAKSLALGVYDLRGIDPGLAEGNVKQALRTRRLQKSSFDAPGQHSHAALAGSSDPAGWTADLAILLERYVLLLL